MKKEKKEKKPYITVEEVAKEGESKYKTIQRIAKKIKSQLELSDERDDKIIYKILEELKGEKNSSGGNG